VQSCGETLRQARLDKGVSLTDAERETRIRRKYLEALEAEDTAALPPPVYTRGFIRAYAEYLGLDPQATVDLYQPVPRRDKAPPLRPVVPGDAIPREIPVRQALYVLGALALIGLLGFAWVRLQAVAEEIRSNDGLPPVRSGTPTMPRGLPTPDTNAFASPSPAMPSPEQLSTPVPSPSPTVVADGILVEFRTTARAYVEASVDGRQALAETLAAGTQRSLPLGQESVIMRVSNGSAIEVTVNGKRQESPGGVGPVEFTWRR
jgi:cytoskeleton protein RodZ